MRILPYDNIEEIIADSRYVTNNHDGTCPISWMPDRLKILGIMGHEFAAPIVEFCKNSAINVANIDMFPAEFIKAAHNFQMSLKQSYSRNNNEICEIYKQLVNLGIEKRQLLTKQFYNLIKNGNIHISKIRNEGEKKQLLYLASLLRASSEILYFDNHTTCGDLFKIHLGNEIIVKSYKNIMTDYMYPNEQGSLPIKEINLFMAYSEFPANFDMIGNYISNVDVNLNLYGYCIEVISPNGEKKYISVDESKEIIIILSDLIAKYSDKYRYLERDVAIEFIVKCLYQVNKPLFDSVSWMYDYTNQLLENVISNYNNSNYLTTVDIFQRFCYNDAVEIIIDPRKDLRS